MAEQGLACKERLCGLVSEFAAGAKALQAPVLLLLRIWIADVFFTSGLAKINDWESTLALFQYEHPVPGLPVPLAAVMGTGVELICPVLLVLGLGTRFAAIPLLVMVAVIELTYMPHKDHQAWALVLLVLLTVGAGKWSFDALLARRYFSAKL